jgi:hypothetical protein
MIPDDTLSTITATVDGKSYKVSAYADSKNLGPLAGLEKALMGDLKAAEPQVTPATAESDGTTKKKSDRSILSPVGDFFGSVGDMVSGWLGHGKKAPAARPASDGTDSVRGVRATGMTDVLGARIEGATDSADGKDASDK